MKIKIDIDNGKVNLGQDKLNDTIKHLKSGEYLLFFYPLIPKTKDEWRKYYFLLRDILFDDGETGYTKNELHEMGKAMIGVQTTKDFTSEQWQKYVQDFKEWAFESFQCYL